MSEEEALREDWPEAESVPLLQGLGVNPALSLVLTVPLGVALAMPDEEAIWLKAAGMLTVAVLHREGVPEGQPVEAGLPEPVPVAASVPVVHTLELGVGDAAPEPLPLPL